MIQVFIADNHTLFREGLKRILEGVKDIAVKGESRSGEETVQAVRQNDYDVILLDAALSEQRDLGVLRRIMEAKPQSRVLMLDFSAEERQVVPAFRLGASGYLTSAEATPDLVNAIRQVAAGKKYVSPPAAEQLVSQLSEYPDPVPHRRLSPREYTVLLHITAGKSVGDMAREMGVSTSTISTLRRRLLNKMKLHSNADIIRYVIEHKLTG